MTFPWKKTAIAFTLALSVFFLNSCSKGESEESAASSNSSDVEESATEQKVPETEAPAKASNKKDSILGKWQMVKLVENGEETSVDALLAEIAKSGDEAILEETKQSMIWEFNEDGTLNVAQEEGTYEIKGDKLTFSDSAEGNKETMNFQVSDTELIISGTDEENKEIAVHLKRLE